MSRHPGIPAVFFRATLYFVVLSTAVTSGCGSTNIDPFDNPDKLFTVFGFLDEFDTEHVLRVIPVTRQPERIVDPSEPAATLDAFVTTTDLTTGNQVTWVHSLEKLSDGTFGHLFRSTFGVRKGRTYRLEIKRNDGRVTRAETTVPSFQGLKPVPETPFTSPDSISQTVTIPGITTVWNTEVLYRFNPPVILPYGRQGMPTTEGWVLIIDVKDDFSRMAELGLNVVGRTWETIGVRMRVLDGNWKLPADLLDASLTASPDAVSNVENGYGFWGSIGLLQGDWDISQEMMEAMGF